MGAKRRGADKGGDLNILTNNSKKFNENVKKKKKKDCRADTSCLHLHMQNTSRILHFRPIFVGFFFFLFWFVF